MKYKDLCLVSTYLILGIPDGNSRKYDIQAESLKLYGEDLQSVLKRFRKTPEYLSILEAKLNDLKMNINFIASNIQAYYEDKMNDKVEEILGANRTCLEDAKRKFLRDRYTPLRRQSEYSVSPPTNMTGVEKLDSYRKLRSALSVEERNKFKDLGFEFAGQITHAIISAVSGEDSLLQSTLLPYGSDDNKDSLTIHTHQVTHVSTSMAEENPTPEGHALHTHPPESFRNYQPNNVFKYS